MIREIDSWKFQPSRFENEMIFSCLLDKNYIGKQRAFIILESLPWCKTHVSSWTDFSKYPWTRLFVQKPQFLNDPTRAWFITEFCLECSTKLWYFFQKMHLMLPTSCPSCPSTKEKWALKMKSGKLYKESSLYEWRGTKHGPKEVPRNAVPRVLQWMKGKAQRYTTAQAKIYAAKPTRSSRTAANPWPCSSSILVNLPSTSTRWPGSPKAKLRRS